MKISILDLSLGWSDIWQISLLEVQLGYRSHCLFSVFVDRNYYDLNYRYTLVNIELLFLTVYKGYL